MLVGDVVLQVPFAGEPPQAHGAPKLRRFVAFEPLMVPEVALVYERFVAGVTCEQRALHPKIG